MSLSGPTSLQTARDVGSHPREAAQGTQTLWCGQHTQTSTGYLTKTASRFCLQQKTSRTEKCYLSDFFLSIIHNKHGNSPQSPQPGGEAGGSVEPGARPRATS